MANAGCLRREYLSQCESRKGSEILTLHGLSSVGMAVPPLSPFRGNAGAWPLDAAQGGTLLAALLWTVPCCAVSDTAAVSESLPCPPLP